MHIQLRTKLVNSNHLAVFQNFNRALFEALSPPFPPFVLHRFDGCLSGDKVNLELNFFLFKQAWNTDIIDHGSVDQKSWFVDSGSKLPFFLSFWEHQHILQQQGNDVVIIDDIQFKGKAPFFSFLVYPILYFTFSLRKPIYRRLLSNLRQIPA
jgi:ligand-binding SRPBCC domain-containing protein